MADVIVRVTPSSGRVALTDLIAAPLGLDVWEVKPDHLVVQAEEAQVARLEAMGFGVEQLRSVEPYLSTFATEAAVTGYHTAATLEQDLRRLAEEHPEIAEIHEIGRSVEGRPLWALRIGERRGSTRKVAFLGCHHAREWISVEVPYLLAEHVLQNSSSDPVQRWLQQGEVWVAPMVNPDGHEHTQTPANRLWRKNRRRNHDGSIGVDPNRNCGYMWGTLNVSTSSHVPADETYVGPRAFSEPEVRAVRDLVARELFSGVLTYHSYSQLIMYPWGHTSEPIRDVSDRRVVRGLAEDMARLIGKVHGRTYTAQQSSALYPTAGDTTDWTYGEYDAVSLTVELRPATWEEGGFILPAAEIQPCWEENRPAAFEFIQRVLERTEG
jgi:carboxypeptidase T